MSYLLRPTAALCAALLFSCFALTAFAQQGRLSALLSDHPMARLSATSGPQAPFVPTKYRMDFLVDEGPPPAYMTLFESTRSYDNGRLTEEVSQTPDFSSETPVLGNSTRTTYSYQNGRVSQETSWNWEANAWVESSRTSYTYNGAGQVTVELREDFVFTRGTWVPDERTTTSYSNGLPAEILVEDWTGSDWTPLDRTLLSEDDGKAVTVDQTWTGSAWLNQTRSRAVSVSLAEMAELFAEFNSTSVFSLLVLVPTRQLAELTYAFEYTDEVWDEMSNTWVNDTRTRVTTNTAASIEALTESWDGTAWEPSERTTLSFDGELLTELRLEDWDGATFAASMRTTYTHDANGNPILAETYGDDDGDGTFDALVSQRIFIEWTDLLGTAVDDAEGLVRASLTAVQPNPASHLTMVEFSLPASGAAVVRVFDALGREVATVAEGPRAAGAHTVSLDASVLPAGVYFIRLEAGDTTATRVLVVAR